MRKIISISIISMLIVPFSLGAAFSETQRGRVAISAQHLRLIEGRLSKQYVANQRKKETPNGRLDVNSVSYRGNYKGAYRQLAVDAARKHGIPEGIFLKLVETESNWKPRAKSHVGAMGLAQLMPGTARYLGVRNPWDPKQNLEGGARYLKMQYNKFRSWKLALAAYNAGPGAVEKYRGVPPYRETQNYVRKILGS